MYVSQSQGVWYLAGSAGDIGGTPCDGHGARARVRGGSQRPALPQRLDARCGIAESGRDECRHQRPPRGSPTSAPAPVGVDLRAPYGAHTSSRNHAGLRSSASTAVAQPWRMCPACATSAWHMSALLPGCRPRRHRSSRHPSRAVPSILGFRRGAWLVERLPARQRGFRNNLTRSRSCPSPRVPFPSPEPRTPTRHAPSQRGTAALSRRRIARALPP
jgi:hypothetical protein